jgi:hypothetical protein
MSIQSPRDFAWSSLLPLLVFCVFCECGGVARADINVGSALRAVTPDPLLPISGGVGPSAPIRGKKGDLFARAMVFEKGETRVAIVGLDFLGFPAGLSDQVREKVPGIPPQNILIGATHNHSGPDMYGFPDGQGGRGGDPKYTAWVIEKTAEAINEAVAKLEPAALRIQVGEAKGKIAYNYYAPQLYDPRCGVIQAIRKGDAGIIATLVNYASHPEVLGPGSRTLSPDFCGPLYDRIEKVTGGMALFMNGAQGGMVTADCRGPDGEDVQTWEECIRIGELLANEALRIVDDAPLQNDPTLYVASRKLTFPVTSPLMQQLIKLLDIGAQQGDDSRTVTTQLNLLNIGTAQLLTIPGEALPNIGYYMKRNMPGKHDFLLGLTNDAFGYILARVDFNSFKRYSYVSRTSLGEMTGEIYMEQALKLVKESPGPDKP